MHAYISAISPTYRQPKKCIFLLSGMSWLSLICLEHFNTQKQSVSLGELYNMRNCHSSDSTPEDSAASKGIRQVMTL